MFQKICSSALQARDLAHLQSMLGDQYLDVIQFKAPQFTPAGYLASQGQHAAVELLRQLGANTTAIGFGYGVAGDKVHADEYQTKYNAEQRRIFEAYAFAGHDNLLPAFLSLDQRTIDAIARGYAMANKMVKVKELADIYRASRTKITTGFVLALNRLLVDEWVGGYPLEINSIAGAFAYIGSHVDVYFYLNMYEASPTIITRHYARSSQHDKVEEFRKEYEVDLYEVIGAYIAVGNHERVLFYQNHHAADINKIAELYAFYGCHKKVNEYRSKYNASNDFIAFGYARARDVVKVTECHELYKAKPTIIAQGYVKSGCHNLVDEYVLNHGADPLEVARFYEDFYPDLKTIPRFYRALIQLVDSGDAGKELSTTLIQLRKNPDSYFSYFTGNNNTKLNAILTALENVPPEKKLAEELANSNSDLNKELHPNIFSGILSALQNSSTTGATETDSHDNKKNN